MTPRVKWIAAGLALALASGGEVGGEVGPPPEAVRSALSLAPFYAKYLDAGGLAIVGSERVNDFALLEARHIVDRMLAGRDDLRAAIAASGTRLVVMAHDELTTDVPEHSDLEPADWWDRRARGLGATPVRPAVSCGEENLLEFPADPYAAENILVHEFGHVIHEMGLRRVDAGFDARLRAARDAALAAGLWEGAYAATNPSEYWAEGVQSWFDTNRADDAQHNHVDTRAELEAYDAGLAALLAEAFPDNDWRYVRPSERPDPAHLAGWDPESAPRFAWPERLKDVDVSRPPGER